MTDYIDIIRELREDRQMSQKDVAEYLGTTQQVYSRYETSENEIPVRHIIALAQLYHVPADYLLGLTEVTQPYPRRGAHTHEIK